MITIESPSMALNDPRVGVAYNMDVNQTVSATANMRDIVNFILTGAGGVTGGVIKNLVFSAHGSPGVMGIGTGLDITTMPPFRDIQGKVFKIWFTGCLTARIAGPQTASHGDGAALRAYGVNSGDGHAFVSAFAKLTHCYVVVPTEMQVSRNATYPPGLVDSYEGLVLCYSPDGYIAWQRRYPSLSHYNVALGTARSPNRE